MAFVQTSGTYFTLNGKKWTPFGGTTYDISFDGIESIRADDKINSALALNLNIIRIVNFFGGDGLNDLGNWAQCDYILDKCRQVGLKVLVDFSDFCGYTGSLTGEHCARPISRNNWYEFVDRTFARVNTLNGRIYKDDDTIAIIAISGENTYNAETQGTILHDFFSDVSARIKATGAQQIVHAGGQIPEIILSTDYTTTFGAQQDMLSISTIDCVSTHPYYTEQNMRDLFPLLQAYSIEKNKPWFIEEFGYNQTTSTYKHDRKRAQHFRFLYDIGLKNNCAGFIFWNIDGGFWNPATGTGGGFGVNVNTPETSKMVQRYSKYNGYSPRIPVDSWNPPVE